MTNPLTILDPDTLPLKGGDMIIRFTDSPEGVRTYYVDRSYRRADGKTTHFKRKTTDPLLHARHIVEAQNIHGECSLTSQRFAECISTYIIEKGTGGFSQACYDRAKKELGRLYSDKPSFAAAFAAYCIKLEAEDFAVNTVNNYKIVIRSVANYAFKTGRAGTCTVRCWNLKQGTERSRILTPAEQLAIENKLREWDSHLIWAFDFAVKNPIRKTDLFNLQRKNLKCDIVEGRQIYYVQFQAKKTRRTANGKITTLPNISPEFVEYERSLPADCPWLFPMIGTKQNGMHTKLKPGKWKKIIDADKHFHSLLTEANINDFHFHDLKHCAETYMLRQGCSYETMQKLGIQMSSKTQKLYDNRSQVELVASVAHRGSSVAPAAKAAV